MAWLGMVILVRVQSSVVDPDAHKRLLYMFRHIKVINTLFDVHARPQVDVYSFGVCMWAMWARRLPYAGQDIARVFMRMVQGHVVRPPLPGG